MEGTLYMLLNLNADSQRFKRSNLKIVHYLNPLFLGIAYGGPVIYAINS